MNPTSVSLRRKLVVLEGSDIVQEECPELEAGLVDAAQSVPICCDKVTPLAFCVDDLALAELLEVALGVTIDRLRCHLDSQDVPPGHTPNDTLVVSASTAGGRDLIVHLRGTLHLLPATELTRRTMHNAFTASTASARDTGCRQPIVVALTIAKACAGSALQGARAASDAHPYLREISFGVPVEPWDSVRFVYLSLQDYLAHTGGAAPSEPSSLPAWCWFLSHYEKVVCPADIPDAVRRSPRIARVWRRLAQLGLSESGGDAFSALWGQAVAATAVNVQGMHMEADRRRADQAEEALKQRQAMFRKQLRSLEEMAAK